MSIYKPVISWETLPKTVYPISGSPNTYRFTVSSYRDPNDYGINQIGTDRFYIVIYTGYIFRITAINVGGNAFVFDAYELTEQENKFGTFINKPAFIYQSLNGAIVLTQAQRSRLDRNAWDIIRNIENAIAGNSLFNWDRAIKRIPTVGLNIGSFENVKDGLEEMFFPFIIASISINSNQYIEVGETVNITISGTVTQNDSSSFANGRVEIGSGGSLSFSSPGSYSVIDNGVSKISEGVAETYISKVEVDDSDGNTQTIESGTKSIIARYPYFYGVSSDQNLSGATLYNNLTKVKENQGTKYHDFTCADGDYIYIVTPSDWNDLSNVTDNGGLGDSVFSAFTTAELRLVDSTGELTPGYNNNFKVYRTTSPQSASEHSLKFDF